MPKQRDEEAGGRAQGERRKANLPDEIHPIKGWARVFYSKDWTTSYFSKGWGFSRKWRDYHLSNSISDVMLSGSWTRLHKSEIQSVPTVNELADRLDQQEAINRTAVENFLLSYLAHGSEEASQELQDEEMLSGVFDWATKSLARTAAMAQETVEHRRALLREMAVRERQIDQKLARTGRTLERLIAG